jgi:hypothetical protein
MIVSFDLVNMPSKRCVDIPSDLAGFSLGDIDVATGARHRTLERIVS